MRDVATFPDSEKAVIGYLLPHLDPGVGIDVRGSGGRFVRVRRVGGIELSPNHDGPTVDVMVWHDTDRLRMQTAQRLWALLRAADGDDATDDAVILYGSTFLGPRQMPDPADDTKTVCLFTVQLVVRSR